jgi:hypothetical protein
VNANKSRLARRSFNDAFYALSDAFFLSGVLAVVSPTTGGKQLE